MTCSEPEAGELSFARLHGKAAEGQDICKLAESLGIALPQASRSFHQSVALGADRIRGCGVEMLSHAENIAQIPVNGRCPCCNKVAVTADIHLRAGAAATISRSIIRISG